MYIIRRLILFFLIFSGVNQAYSQQFSFKGYLKDLKTINFTDPDTISIQNLIHNRLNCKYKISDNLKISLEIRNRLFFGELPDTTSILIEKLKQQNDFFTLSTALVRTNSLLLYTMIDRCYFEWQKNDFEIKLGRQRINWGVNLFWNPNDIFNVYSFYDFDYEERPGSDAFLIRYNTGVVSSIEVTSKITDNFKKSTFAGMWKINKWDYDFQLIAGKMKQDIMFGVGWAGNISSAGFKGECSYFYPYEDTIQNNVVTVGISSAYSFSEKFFLNGELLFNSSGKNKVTLEEFNQYISTVLTSKNLSPTKFSIAIQPVINFNPKYSASCSSVWYLGENAFYLSPTFSVHIKENFDLDLIGQIIASDITGKYDINESLLSVRFKWNF